MGVGDGTTLAMKKHYVLKHYPEAHPEYMTDAGRWVVLYRGNYGQHITIGTGSNLQQAWTSAYKYALENPSPLVNTVSTPKISTTLPWKTNSIYRAGDTVLFPDGYKRDVIMGGTTGSTLPSLLTTNSEVDAMSDSGTVRFGAPHSGPEKSKGSLEYPAVRNPYTGLWKPLSTDTMPVGWHPEREYDTGEVVYMKDGGTKVYANGKLYDLISHKTIAGETLHMNPITNEVFHSNVLAQGAKTAQGIAALKQQADSGALDKLKQSIDKKFNMHVGQYIPVDNKDDFQVLTKDKIKPIDSSSKYKVKFTETLKPMLLPKKYNPTGLEEEEEEFAPVPTKKDKPFSSINVKADLTNQALVQHIGVASNCNVIIQQAFSSKGAFGRKVRLVCKQCNKDKVYFDEAVFHMTPEGIVNELKEFCFAHRHDGSGVEMPWKTVAVPDPKKLENFRRFREE